MDDTSLWINHAAKISINITWKKNTEVRITQNKGKESGNSYQKIEEITIGQAHETHGNLIKIFRQARPSFSIGRE